MLEMSESWLVCSLKGNPPFSQGNYIIWKKRKCQLADLGVSTPGYTEHIKPDPHPHLHHSAWCRPSAVWEPGWEEGPYSVHALVVNLPEAPSPFFPPLSSPFSRCKKWDLTECSSVLCTVLVSSALVSDSRNSALACQSFCSLCSLYLRTSASQGEQVSKQMTSSRLF